MYLTRFTDQVGFITAHRQDEGCDGLLLDHGVAAPKILLACFNQAKPSNKKILLATQSFSGQSFSGQKLPNKHPYSEY